MNREYELYERCSNDVLNWRGLVRGLDHAWVSVQLITAETGNECFAVPSTTVQPVLIRTPTQRARRVFQIAYDSQMRARASLLRSRGYDVTSALGNAAAWLMLDAGYHYDLFIIGPNPTTPVRQEMAHWLREHYAHSGVVALTLPGGADLAAVTYNSPSDPPEAWLPWVNAAAERHPRWH